MIEDENEIQSQGRKDGKGVFFFLLIFFLLVMFALQFFAGKSKGDDPPKEGSPTTESP